MADPFSVLSSLFFGVLLVCTIEPLRSENLDCPSQCSCLGNIVECQQKDLREVPKDLPIWVTALYLGKNLITEIKDEDFKGFNSLQELDLSLNQLSFVNGSAFRHLHNLKQLKLGYNQLTEFPEFSTDSPLTHLSLAHNKISSLPARVIDNLPQLRQLDLNNNKIDRVSNTTFSIHPYLHQLYLSNNRISHLDRNAFSNLTNLEWLKLNKNKIATFPKDTFARLGRLKTLELVKNSLQNIEGLTFQGLAALQLLRLRRNGISALADGAFYGLHVLTALQLDHNNISVVRKGWTYGLDQLQQLSLGHNQISHIYDDAWEECTSLTDLDLTHNKLRLINASTFASLSALKHLVLDHNQVAFIKDGSFAHLNGLQVLMLSYNNISWTVEDLNGAFDGLSGLTRLGLAHNQIKSVAKRAFAELQSLRQLYLEGNSITSIQVNSFDEMSELSELRLNSSSLICDCELSWLARWIVAKGFQQTVSAVCAHPQEVHGISVLEVQPDQFRCEKFPKPHILTHPQTLKALKGGNITLVCEAASSESAMTPVWKKDNIILPSDLVTNTESVDVSGVTKLISVLHISGATNDNSGSYQCVVSNDLGTRYSQKADVAVYVFPTFMKTPSNVTVKAGSEAVFECAATGEPPPEIAWQKVGGDDFLAARERRMGMRPDDKYFIDQVKSQDQGMYSCMASNAAGTIVANATLSVLVNPHFIEPMMDKHVEEGSDVVFYCKAAGNPLPKLQWLKDGIPLNITERHFLTAQDQVLLIMHVTEADSGEYMCVMTNTLGSERGMSLLTVGNPHAFKEMSDTTTTGIIIITVVCGVVGTSIIWVIIIYHTRRKRRGAGGAEPPTSTATGPGGAYAYKTYAEVNSAFSQQKLLYSQSPDPTNQQLDSNHHNDLNTGTLSSWHSGRRRPSDSDSSHSTQSTRSTGLLSTFHPTAASLPRPGGSTTLSYSPADVTTTTTPARQGDVPPSAVVIHPPDPGDTEALASVHTPSVAVVAPRCSADTTLQDVAETDSDAEIYSNRDASDVTPSHTSNKPLSRPVVVASIPRPLPGATTGAGRPLSTPGQLGASAPHPTTSHRPLSLHAPGHKTNSANNNSCQATDSCHGDKCVEQNVPVINPPPLSPNANGVGSITVPRSDVANGVIPGSAKNSSTVLPDTKGSGVVLPTSKCNGVVQGSPWIGNGGHVIPNGHAVTDSHSLVSGMAMVNSHPGVMVNGHLTSGVIANGHTASVKT